MFIWAQDLQQQLCSFIEKYLYSGNVDVDESLVRLLKSHIPLMLSKEMLRPFPNLYQVCKREGLLGVTSPAKKRKYSDAFASQPSKKRKSKTLPAFLQDTQDPVIIHITKINDFFRYFFYFCRKDQYVIPLRKCQFLGGLRRQYFNFNVQNQFYHRFDQENFNCDWISARAIFDSILGILKMSWFLFFSNDLQL